MFLATHTKAEMQIEGRRSNRDTQALFWGLGNCHTVSTEESKLVLLWLDWETNSVHVQLRQHIGQNIHGNFSKSQILFSDRWQSSPSLEIKTMAQQAGELIAERKPNVV